jgi:FKBP-type peptidyl-prolyl cis-trans isomerase SlyD
VTKRRKKRGSTPSASSPAVPDGAYQAGPGIVVTLEYDVFDAEGEHVGGSRGACDVVLGYGQLLPAVEREIEGLWPGAQKSVRVRAADAYGERNPDAWIELERDEFPDDVTAGDSFEAEGEDGVVVVLKVLEVDEDRVVVDQNHPLAGQALRVEVRVLGTRPATAEELEAAESALEGDDLEADSPVIPVDRLLRGPTRS